MSIDTCEMTRRELVSKACEISPYRVWVVQDLYCGTDMDDREYLQRL